MQNTLSLTIPMFPFAPVSAPRHRSSGATTSLTGSKFREGEGTQGTGFQREGIDPALSRGESHDLFLFRQAAQKGDDQRCPGPDPTIKMYDHLHPPPFGGQDLRDPPPWPDGVLCLRPFSPLKSSEGPGREGRPTIRIPLRPKSVRHRKLHKD
ncbi:MAG: hypothetical protein AAF600_15690 [Bacteroidota bacterium]